MKIRDYVSSDHPAIIEITKHIWDGNDYLPDRIHFFMKDSRSFPIVIEDDTGKVVSVANTRLISDKIAWLEAMRTHEDNRGKGFGTTLTEGQLDKAKANGAKKAWLFTHCENQATRRITEKLGFNEIARYSLWGWGRKDMAEYKEGSVSEVDREGKLIKLSYLPNHVSDKVKTLTINWIKANSIEEIKKILKHIASNNHDVNIMSEFYSYPFDSYEVTKWFDAGEIYINAEINSVMTIRKSKEVDGMSVIGITTDNEDGISSGMLFLHSKISTDKIILFFSSKINHPLFNIESHQFKLFEYIL